MLLCVPALLAAQQSANHSEADFQLLASHGVVDLSGNAVHEIAGPGVKLVVLVFGSTDCPISNRYIPEVARLRKLFGAADAKSTGPVRFWWVYPNSDDTAELIRTHNNDFNITQDMSLGTLIDQKTQILAHESNASTTPEAALFANDNGKLRLLYHGRLDNKYIAFGQERPQADQHDLEVAIRAALAGKAVPQPGGPPVGCSIVYAQK